MMNNPHSSCKAREALELFHQGYSCAQSVFAPFAQHCGLDKETALKLAAPFGAGIGRMREVCGAFCGASLALGSVKGNATPDADSKEKIYALVQEIAEHFKMEFGSIYCRELLDLDSEAGEETPRPSERTPAYYESRPCERCIATCAALAEKYMEN